MYLALSTLQHESLSQSIITCLKIGMVTVAKCVKYVHSYQERHPEDISDVFLVSFLLTLDIFLTLF